MHKQAKSEYKKIFGKVRVIINRFDSACLEPGRSGSNTPIEEYDPEVARIVAYFIHHQEQVKLNPTLLLDEINRIWNEYFGEDCQDAKQIVDEIIKSCS